MRDLLELVTNCYTKRFTHTGITLPKLNSHIGTILVNRKTSMIVLSDDFAFSYSRMRFINGCDFNDGATRIEQMGFISSIGNARYIYLCICVLEDMYFRNPLGRELDQVTRGLLYRYLEAIKEDYNKKYGVCYRPKRMDKGTHTCAVDTLRGISFLIDKRFLSRHMYEFSNMSEKLPIRLNNKIKVYKQDYLILNTTHGRSVLYTSGSFFGAEAPTYKEIDYNAFFKYKSRSAVLETCYVCLQWYISTYIDVLDYSTIDILAKYLSRFRSIYNREVSCNKQIN